MPCGCRSLLQATLLTSLLSVGFQSGCSRCSRAQGWRRDGKDRDGRASEDKPWSHCPLPVSFTDKTQRASSPSGILDTVPGGGRASRSLQLAAPPALVAFLARCVVVNCNFTVSRDWLILLSPDHSIHCDPPECLSAKKQINMQASETPGRESVNSCGLPEGVRPQST